MGTLFSVVHPIVIHELTNSLHNVLAILTLEGVDMSLQI